MYAVIATGGKQYRVQPGDTVEVEKLDGEPGKTIELSEVLLVVDGDNIRIGQPRVEGAKVVAEVVGNTRGEKLRIYKYRRRKGYRRKTGHRQTYTTLKISTING